MQQIKMIKNVRFLSLVFYIESSHSNYKKSNIFTIRLGNLWKMIFLLFSLLLNRYSAAVMAIPMDDATGPVPTPTFRVMTFNTWNTGAHVRDGLYKIAKHIRYVYPDIVAIQEFHYATDVPEVLKLLGPEWSGVGKRAEQGYLDAAILTRHEMLTESWTSVASALNDGPAEKNGAKRAVVRLKLSNYATPFTVNFWSLHLDYHDYGPYALCNKMVTKLTYLPPRKFDAAHPFQIEFLATPLCLEDYCIALWLHRIRRLEDLSTKISIVALAMVHQAYQL
uniref:Endonuclease/exonuclease/phosphatase domain-containing protein n=1 Tax=Romanomermis culicivorax TaxID=13658 RepID=A0A915I9Z5_ROMCU